MSSSDLIFIIGRQRSGTTVLRDMLARHGAMDCDEIMHGEPNPDFPLRFYEYVASEVIRRPEYAHPLRHLGLFYSYVNELRAIAGSRKLAMDVKYFGLNLIPQKEDVLGRTPFIIKFMREQRARVVHLVRANKLRVHVSEQMAYATGRWSAGDRSAMPAYKPRLEIDIEKCVSFIKRQITLDQHVSRLLDVVPGVIKLQYHEMFDADGLFAESTQRIVGGLLDRGEIDPKPGNLRMNPEPLSHLVTNYEALHEALQGTQYAWMLTDEY